MTQVTLNVALMLQIFQVVAAQADKDSYAVVQAESPEVKDLIARKYIKLNKKLQNTPEGVAAVLVAGANEADLKADLGITDGTPVAAPTVPTVAPTVPVAAETPVVPPAPAPFPVPEVDDVPQVIPQPELASENVAVLSSTPAAFEPLTPPTIEPAQHTQQTLADVTVDGNTKIIGAGEVETVASVETRNGVVDIQVGVPFVFKESARKKADGAGRETHPYKSIADFKLANPTTIPSFHIAGRKVKDVSNSVNSHSDKYEAAHGITFRAQATDATDALGEGVRVFAMFTAEAPPRRKLNRTKAAAPAAAPIAETPAQ